MWARLSALWRLCVSGCTYVCVRVGGCMVVYACSFMQAVGGLLAKAASYVTLMSCCPTAIE